MSNDKRIFDLEDRLIDFAVQIIHLPESLIKENKTNPLRPSRLCGEFI